MGCTASNDTKPDGPGNKQQEEQLFFQKNEEHLNKLEQAKPEIIPPPQLLLFKFKGTNKPLQMLNAIKQGNLQGVIDICEKDLMNPNENISGGTSYWSVLHYAARFNNMQINGIASAPALPRLCPVFARSACRSACRSGCRSACREGPAEPQIRTANPNRNCR